MKIKKKINVIQLILCVIFILSYSLPFITIGNRLDLITLTGFEVALFNFDGLLHFAILLFFTIQLIINLMCIFYKPLSKPKEEIFYNITIIVLVIYTCLIAYYPVVQFSNRLTFNLGFLLCSVSLFIYSFIFILNFIPSKILKNNKTSRKIYIVYFIFSFLFTFSSLGLYGVRF